MVKSKTKTTLDLIKDSAKGNEEAIKSLFGIYWPRVHHAVRLRLGADLRRLYHSRDIPLQALGRAIRSFPLIKWQGEGSFLGWLYYIALGLVRNEADSPEEGKSQADPEGEKQWSGETPSTAFPSRWERSESFQKRMKELEPVRAVLEEIPHELKALLDLRLFMKMSLVELSQYLGITPEDAARKLREAVSIFAEACLESDAAKRSGPRRSAFQKFLKKYEEGKIPDPPSHFDTLDGDKEKLSQMWDVWNRAKRSAGWKRGT